MMRVKAIALAVLFGSAALSWAGSPPGTTGHPGPIVHEWGTFLSMQGSDGVPLGGMVDSDEVLPTFVRERALNGIARQLILSKMETPVTYFYTDQPMTVQVRVDMRNGMLTHWFPAAGFSPTPEQQAKAKNTIHDSSLTWNDVQLFPPKAAPKGYGLRAVDQDSVWRFARETDADIVRVNHRTKQVPYYVDEKFLFYRGLGRLDLPMEVRSTGLGKDTQLILHNHGSDVIPGAFAVQVQGGTIRWLNVSALDPNETRPLSLASFSSALPLNSGVARAKDAVAASLVETGLYAKEARAMVNTWEKSYFRTPGLRVLYLLPQRSIDEVIPIHIQPAPRAMVRVMVGRVEVLTPEQERRIVQAVAGLTSSLKHVQNAAQAELAMLGRFQEPALHRVAAVTHEPAVKAEARKLLKKLEAAPR